MFCQIFDNRFITVLSLINKNNFLLTNCLEATLIIKKYTIFKE